MLLKALAWNGDVKVTITEPFCRMLAALASRAAISSGVKHVELTRTIPASDQSI